MSKTETKNKFKLLVVDDEEDQRSLLAGALIREGYEVGTASNFDEAKSLFEAELFDMVITDQKLKDGRDGIQILEHCRKANPEIPVVLVTAYGNIDSAVTAMKYGAYYYMTKPIRLEDLIELVRKALQEFEIVIESRALQEIYEEEFSEHPIVAQSREMREVLSLVSRVANYNISVLLTGESGVGKEVVARAIHSFSLRKNSPFIAVNCSAIPDTLLEAELFGSEKGAYTGAVSARKGRLELAQGGTLFLDEIGDISPLIQVKLLRFLSERTYEKLGGEKTIEADVRIIAATNRNLSLEMKDGKFREDLFYRLNVVNIEIPPLRERREDIIPLARRIIKNLSSKIPEKKELKLTWEAEKRLITGNWPGNIRELENVLQRAFVLSRGAEIDSQDLSLTGDTEDLSLEALEKKQIEKVLSMTSGNLQKASQILKIHRNTLREKMKYYGLK
ncbi:sigma-54-dependent Fis family transcriptional regulator [candidate division WOR-3 bacterium]|nr:sigma-54-dependent Fis family transcriptional regulator [candidate division WOR-3 bacterium]